VGLGTYQVYMTVVARRQNRRDTFNGALNAQNATQKPLLVVGDPDGRFLARTLGRDFDCGTTCLDARGCPKCPDVIANTPLAGLQSLEGDSHVIFVDAGQLEKVGDAGAALRELNRVSGGDLFVSRIQPWSLDAWVWPNKRRVLSAPPDTAYTEWRELPWQPGKSEVQRLGSLRLVNSPRERWA
jgi:hypothetical protein